MRLIIAATLLTSLLAGPVLAADHPGKGQPSRSSGGTNVSIQIGGSERSIVQEYYGAQIAQGHCPPGLAKKHNGCMPPGQAKKLYRIGQRYPRSYGNLWSYNQIPYDLRQRYDFNRNDRYYYGDGYVYRVDPRTMLIEQVVSALLR